MDDIIKCERHNTVRDATQEPHWGCRRERREAFVRALNFDERIWRARLLLKPIHRDEILDALVGAP